MDNVNWEKCSRNSMKNQEIHINQILTFIRDIVVMKMRLTAFFVAVTFQLFYYQPQFVAQPVRPLLLASFQGNALLLEHRIRLLVVSFSNKKDSLFVFLFCVF